MEEHEAGSVPLDTDDTGSYMTRREVANTGKDLRIMCMEPGSRAPTTSEATVVLFCYALFGERANCDTLLPILRSRFLKHICTKCSKSNFFAGSI